MAAVLLLLALKAYSNYIWRSKAFDNTPQQAENIKNAVYKLQPNVICIFPNKIRIMASKKIEFSWQLPNLDIFCGYWCFHWLLYSIQQWFINSFLAEPPMSPLQLVNNDVPPLTKIDFSKIP
jgi:hypothetical protein